MRDHPATYVVFDLLRLDGRDLMQTSLRIRKKTLKDVLTPVDGVMYADHVERDGESFFAAVSSQGIEGMVAKRAELAVSAGTAQPRLGQGQGVADTVVCHRRLDGWPRPAHASTSAR